ncbi:MAG TPA: GNAT family N-acetyltransferase [Gaiellaceae bacterium]|jgi:GNAT superfamily N-acetyltransferase|nr:GNAT family N-acetyltransferase [Gaiellaceae bacterium]
MNATADAGEFVIRPGRPGDGPALARIHLDGAAYYLAFAPDEFQLPDEDGLVAYIEAELEPDEGSLVLVADLDGRPAAAIFARIVPALEEARFQWNPAFAHTRLSIEYLATGEGQRRHGAATALVEAAEQWGRDRGATLAFTDTFLRSPASLPFWRDRMGYAERSVSLYKPL